MNNKIIVVNDDGYLAPGIDLLAKAFMPYGEVVMFAPSVEQSAKSQAGNEGKDRRAGIQPSVHLR